ncbi:MAG: hypothetical protein E2O63_05360 [Gammaproteobacteria bacterium]|nr:MAG: hypothetical protein E2O63_05360 [Gammaproteobacteria bacterium]
MTQLSVLANVAEILGVLIVIGGVFFAMLQMRQIRQQRRELAAIELFRFFASPKFTEAYRTILHLPDGMSAEDIRMNEAKIENAAMLISTTMENIGVMTFQRIVPFLVVSNLVGTSVIILWRKLEDWVIALRVEIDSPNGFEWFQWLAERLEQYQPAGTKPAYEAFETWAPIRLTQDS